MGRTKIGELWEVWTDEGRMHLSSLDAARAYAARMRRNEIVHSERLREDGEKGFTEVRTTIKTGVPMKAQQHSDWGAITTTIDGKKVTAETRVVATWPNGTRSTHSVSFRDRHNVVYDMGRRDDVTAKIAGIDVDVRGIMVWIELGPNGPDVEIATPEGLSPSDV